MLIAGVWTHENKSAKWRKSRRKRRTKCIRRRIRKRKGRRERSRKKDGVPKEDDPVVASFPEAASGDAPLWIVLVLQHHVGHLQGAVDIVKRDHSEGREGGRNSESGRVWWASLS